MAAAAHGYYATPLTPRAIAGFVIAATMLPARLL